MTQQTPQRTAQELAEKVLAWARDRFDSLARWAEVKRAELDQRRQQQHQRERHERPVKVLSPEEASPRALARDPHATIMLTEEMSEQLDGFEQEARAEKTSAHEATTA